MALKSYKLGNLTTNQKKRKKIVLGNPKATNDKYKVDVSIKIERPGEAPVILKNPSLFFAPPHEKAPSWIEQEVVVYEDDGQE